jgi:hypothetical protein
LSYLNRSPRDLDALSNVLSPIARPAPSRSVILHRQVLLAIIDTIAFGLLGKLAARANLCDEVEKGPLQHAPVRVLAGWEPFRSQSLPISSQNHTRRHNSIE